MTDIVFTDEINCTLVQAMAHDLMVVNAARVSFNRQEIVALQANEHDTVELPEKDRGLINFLMREQHGTPFEHNVFTFLVDAPIVVAREHMRHRIGHSYNEWSARYSKMEPRFYVPSNVRSPASEKPGAYSFQEAEEVLAGSYRSKLKERIVKAWQFYEESLEGGVAKEQARGILPVYTYTKYFWTCNARSLMHFVNLRNAPSAMWEISRVAVQAEEAFGRQMPVTAAAFVTNGRVAP